MPRIPGASTVSLTPLPRAESGTGERIAQTVRQDLHAALSAYGDASRKQEFINLSGELDRRLLDVETEIERDPEIKTASDASRIYQERSQPIIDEILGRSQWKAVGMALRGRAQGATLRGHASVSKTGYAKEIDAAKAAFDANEDTATALYSRSDDPVERAAILAKAETDLNLSEFIGEQEKELRRKNLQTRAAGQRASKLINEGRFDDAEEFIKSDEAAYVLDESQILALNRTLEIERNRHKQRITEAQERALNARRLDIAIQMNNITDPSQINEIEQQIIALWNDAGQTSAATGNAISQYNSLYSKTAKMREEAADIAAVKILMDSGLPINPEDDEKIDTYYSKYLLPERAWDLNPQELMEANVAFVDRTNMVPKAMHDDIITLASSDNPQHVSYAAEMYRRFKHVAPHARMKFNRNERSLLNEMVRAGDLNMDPTRILERQRKILEMDEEDVRAGKAKYRELTKDDKDVDWLKSQDALMEIRRVGAWDPKVDEIPTEFYGPFSHEVQQNVIAGMTLKDAREDAFMQAVQTWGPTRIGRSGVMNYAPTKMYPEWNGDEQAMELQLIRDVRDENESIRQEFSEYALRGRLLLKPWPEAGRELPTPGYHVFLLTEDKKLDRQILNKDGSAFRFYPNYWKSARYVSDQIVREFETKEANRAAMAAEAWLEGRGRFDEIKNVDMEAYALYVKSLKLAVPIVFDPETARESSRKLVDGINESSRKDREQAIRSWRALFESIREANAGISEKRKRLEQESATPESTIALRERTAKEMEERNRAIRHAVELLEQQEGLAIPEPTYTKGWLESQTRTGG